MKPSQVTKANEANVWGTHYGSDEQKRVLFRKDQQGQAPLFKVSPPQFY